ncbi:DsbA family protein [Enterobacter asburiae]|uniref:DsbA family protein n=1 Tax=Enterobacter cloacae complex TaxID=354276 RepID=UPI0018C26ACC|nr:DsbA family protein [Enterobacter hormaechei]MBG0534137.1 thioredoxin domain-containing protein [Enterobacter hormaechei]MBN6356461.1 thioredoxin domain-containing protein [Escherichia coli]HCT9532829.1 thioredoxin domain-containing protein [Enterobacter hormaechei]
MKLKTVLAAPLITAMLFNSLPSFASDTSSAFTTEQEKRIGEIAADYMRAHPDILIQMSETLQQEQQEKQTRGLKSAALAQQARIMADKRIPSWGAEGGSVMVVEFFDYQCIWCSRLAPELEKVMKANTNVRYYFMEWPVFGSRWPESLIAAKTGLQVWKEKGEQAYLKYHNGIYSSGLNEGKLTQGAIGKYSENMKFSKNTIDEINSTLTDINDIATTIGLTGTPGIVIMPVKGATEDNTTVFAGMTEAENIQQAIDKAQGK